MNDGAHSDVQLDDNGFRVTKWTVQPLGTIPMHSHDHPYVVVPLTSGTLQVTGADGTRSTTQLRPGVTYSRPVGSRHRVSNPSPDTPLAFLEVEAIGGGDVSRTPHSRPAS